MDKTVTMGKNCLLELEPITLFRNFIEINYKNQRHKTHAILFQMLAGLVS